MRIHNGLAHKGSCTRSGSYVMHMVPDEVLAAQPAPCCNPDLSGIRRMATKAKARISSSTKWVKDSPMGVVLTQEELNDGPLYIGAPKSYMADLLKRAQADAASH